MTRRILLGAVLLLAATLARAQGIELPRQADCEAAFLKAKGSADQARWEEACAGFQALIERKDDVTGVVPVTEVFSRGWREAARCALLALPTAGRAAYEKQVGAAATEALAAAKAAGKRQALWAVERRWPASDAAREARRLLSGDDAPPAEAVRALETTLDADLAPDGDIAGTALRIARLAAKLGEPARVQLLARRAAKEWAEKKAVVDGKEVALTDAIRAEAANATVAPTAERPHWGGSPAGVGLLPEVKRITRFLWEQDVEEGEGTVIQGGMVVLDTGGGPGPASPPVVSEGRLYFVAGDRAMCKDVARGNHIWTCPVQQAAVQAGMQMVQRDGEAQMERPLPPCVDGGLVAFEYGRNRNGTDLRRGRALPRASEVHVVDAANGKRLWSWSTEKDDTLKGKSSLSAPVLTPEGLYTLALANDGAHRTATLLMFERERGDGGPKWRRTLATAAASASPWSAFTRDADSVLAYADGAVIVATNLGVVAAVDAASGDVLWTYAYGSPKSGGGGNVSGNMIDARRASPPASWAIASDGAVFFGAADTPYAWGIVPRTGKHLWHNLIAAGMTPAAYSGGRLYLTGSEMYVVDVVTGKRGWFQIPGAFPQAAITSNAALCWSGKALFARDLAHGDELGQYAWMPPLEQAKLKPPDGAILPLGDRILFQARGQFYCFRLEDPPPPPEDIDARVDRWIAQLASPKYAERSAAANALLETGEPAEAKLKAAAESPDREVSWRAEEVLQERKLGTYWRWIPKGPK